MTDPTRESANEVPDLEVPDLELEPLQSRRSVPRSVAPPAATPAPASLGLPELDLEAGVELTLGSAHGGGAESYFGAANFAGDFDEDAMLGNAASFALASESYGELGRSGNAEAAWPNGRTPDASRLEIGADEVERAAAYGPAGKGPHRALPYACRVFVRQRALRAELLAADGELGRAEADRDVRLAELALEVRPKLEQSERFRRLLDPLADLDRVAVDRGEVLSEVSAEFEGQLAALDTELATVNAELGAATSAEQALGRVFGEREAGWKRADAKLKRTNIELRNLVESTRQAPDQPRAPLPPEKAREHALLNERLATQKAEAARAREDHDRAQAEHSSARQRVRELEKDAQRIGQHKASLTRKYQAHFDVHSRGLGEAETRRLAALAEIGRAVLAARGEIDVRPAVLSAISEADREIAALSRKAALWLRALDAYDRDALKQGQSVALAIVAAALLWIALELFF